MTKLRPNCSTWRYATSPRNGPWLFTTGRPRSIGSPLSTKAAGRLTDDRHSHRLRDGHEKWAMETVENKLPFSTVPTAPTANPRKLQTTVYTKYLTLPRENPSRSCLSGATGWLCLKV